MPGGGGRQKCPSFFRGHVRACAARSAPSAHFDNLDHPSEDRSRSPHYVSGPGWDVSVRRDDTRQTGRISDQGQAATLLSHTGKDSYRSILPMPAVASRCRSGRVSNQQ